MEIAEFIKIIVVLAVIGFGVWLAEHAPISDVFKKAIQFVAIIFALLYVLRIFGII
jgi:hypothetical protein